MDFRLIVSTVKISINYNLFHRTYIARISENRQSSLIKIKFIFMYLDYK